MNSKMSWCCIIAKNTAEYCAHFTKIDFLKNLFQKSCHSRIIHFVIIAEREIREGFQREVTAAALTFVVRKGSEKYK